MVVVVLVGAEAVALVEGAGADGSGFGVEGAAVTVAKPMHSISPKKARGRIIALLSA